MLSVKNRIVTYQEYKKDKENGLLIDKTDYFKSTTVYGSVIPENYGESQSINGIFVSSKGTQIVCRHLACARGVGTSHTDEKSKYFKNKRNEFNQTIAEGLKQGSLSTVDTSIGKELSQVDSDDLTIRSGASEFLLFSFDWELIFNNEKKQNTTFPELFEQINAILDTIQLGEKQSLLLCSETHAIQIQLNKKKNGIIKVRLFDPNFHFYKNEKNPQSDELILITSQENFTNENFARLRMFIFRYFIKNNEIGRLIRYGEIKKTRWQFKQNFTIKNHSELEYLTYCLRAHTGLNFTQNLDELIFKNFDNFKENFKENFIIYETSILNSELNESYKLNIEKKLLFAIEHNDKDGIDIYVNAILNSKLDIKHKIKLLRAGLALALKSGHKDAVEVFVKAILNSELDIQDKIELLLAKDQEGTSGLFLALKNGHKDAVEFYVNVILNSELEQQDKLKLLEGKNLYGTSGLIIAFRYKNCKDVIDFYVNAILKSKLEQPHKLALLKSGSELFFDLEKDYKDYLEIYVNAILNSELEQLDKVRLLTAKRESYGINHYWLGDAIRDRRNDTIEVYVNAILNSELENSYKVELLTHESSDNIDFSSFPAYYRESVEVYYKKTVEVYVKAILNSNLERKQKLSLLLVHQYGKGHRFFKHIEKNIKEKVEALFKTLFMSIYKPGFRRGRAGRLLKNGEAFDLESVKRLAQKKPNSATAKALAELNIEF